MLQPLLADILFVLLTLSVAAGALLGWRTAFRRSSLPPENQRRATRWAVLMGFNWLVFSGALAALGWLRNWHTLPPPLLLVLLPPVGFALVLLRSARVGALLDRLPLAALVAPQVFRVAVEGLLWLLYQQGRLPVQMTLEGRNGDILVGLTALPVAWWLVRRPRPALAIAWNAAGLLLLANIVGVAVLSTPLPFRQFHNEPANTIIADFPYVWLPGVLVPVAYCLHLLAWRQAVRRGRTATR